MGTSIVMDVVICVIFNGNIVICAVKLEVISRPLGAEQCGQYQIHQKVHCCRNGCHDNSDKDWVNSRGYCDQQRQVPEPYGIYHCQYYIEAELIIVLFLLINVIYLVPNI